jgi:hypothetical protein
MVDECGKPVAQIQVKKVVAVCFHEAAKMVLEQLGARRLELSEHGTQTPADLTRIYNDVRRVRDYLQRCISGFAEVVDLDLAPDDFPVLVACCRYAVEAMDLRVLDPDVTAEDREWLQKKQQVVSHWAVELAEKPLLELPLKRTNLQQLGEASRTLTSRLQQKAYGDVNKRPKIRPSKTPPKSRIAGVPQPAEEELDLSLRDARVDVEADWSILPLTTSSLPAAAQGAQPPAPPPPPPLFDHHRIGDPRLRAMVGVDLRSYERAVAASDHRLATVLLAAVVEAAVLDHVFARRSEFGVAGSPDAWNVQDLLFQALGEQAAPKDRSLAYHLFSARNLVRPAVQVVAPIIVTSSSFDVLREFAQRALHGLGYGDATGPAPAGTAFDARPGRDDQDG